MQGKIALEEHFAIEPTLGDSKVFGAHVWPDLGPRLIDVQDTRLREMDKHGVEMMILSLNAPAVQAIHDVKTAIAVARQANDVLADHIAKRPARFAAFAALPMQDPEKAAAELRRAMKTLGLRGAMIGSNVNGKNLDDPSFEPLWAAAAELDAFMFIHPVTVAGSDRLKSYYLVNLVGNPLDTTIAAACLVFGGVLDRYPKLKFLLAHGGGFLPYQAGRWEHGWQVREEPKKNVKAAPKNIIHRFLYDTICHSRASLEFLIAQAGVERVLMGSDYPYDMGMLDCVRDVRALSIPQDQCDTIIGKHAQAMLEGRK